jgi:hypothetical protein
MSLSIALVCSQSMIIGTILIRRIIMYRKLMFLMSFALVVGLLLTNSTKAADPDLAAYWKFDEGSGTTAFDSSGNGNDGVFVGDPQWVAGKFGGALEFNGDDYINCGNGDSLQIQDEITIAFWFQVEAFSNTWEGFLAKGDNSYRASRSGGTGNATHMGATGTTVGGGNGYFDGTIIVTGGQWHHYAATYDGAAGKIYIDGVLDVTSPGTGQIAQSSYDLLIGENQQATGRFLHGLMDEVRIYSRALTDSEIVDVMNGAGADFPFASGPNPADGSLYSQTWVSLTWRAGDFAVSHDVYMGDDFDDVNDATPDSEVFRGNQDLDTTFYFAGFVGGAYPDGLVNGTTYYWRIDEVNDADPNSPWKGPVWSFTVPPKTAYFPNPAEGAEFVNLDVRLTWTAGFGAKIHYIVFGEDFDEVNNAAMGKLNGTTSYNPGPLKLAKTYYWRVDESDGLQTYKGDVWSFTTLGAVTGPNPADGALDVKPSIILKWVAGAVAESHEVYFGTDADAVRNATKASTEYKGPKALGEETYDPGKLTMNNSYFWRIDEVNSINPDSPWASNVWSFTTGDYFVIDDFEDYDAADNQIWFSWHDGLGAGAPGMPDYVPGNGTGSAVGDETTPSYTEETIVHGGLQSMPISYDNNKQGFSKYSETDLTLTDQRDWTEEGVANLSLWFRGYPVSVGSFVEGPVGTYTMTGSGADIWNLADQFHFAYKTLTGVGSIVAKVESVDPTNNWAKAGVMIRETLEPGSKHAMTVVTPAQGVSFQRRPETDNTSLNTDVTGLAAPYWVKIERDLAGNFTGSRSANGSTWEMIGAWENIQMSANVYIGLAVTSHDAALTCQAVFTNVTTTGNVSGQWTSQDIGIESNDAEPLYVAVSNSTGTPAVVVHDDPAAVTIDTWTEWVIPLQTLADQGIVLTNVDRIAIGLGTQGNLTIPGGSGKVFIDDIRLTQPAPEPEPQP